MRRKKILFIIYDLERGGPEMRLLDFARHFDTDLKMYLCITSGDVSMLEEFNKHDIVCKILPIKRPYWEIKNLMRLRHFIMETGATIVNSFDLKGLLISGFVRYTTGNRFKIVFHNVNSLSDMNQRQTVGTQFALKMADKVICNSEFSEHEIISHLGIPSERTSVIYNGVDIDHFNSNIGMARVIRTELGIKESDIVLGTIANFREQKNYPFLMRSFESLRKIYQNLKLLCVGGGPRLQEIMKMSEKLGISDSVIFTGYTSEVVRFLNAMDIFVLCSLWEGFPNVILQAMSMGIPVIASSVGGCKEVIIDGISGFLFRPDDHSQFLRMTSELIDVPKRRIELVENAKILVNQKFSLVKMIDIYSKFYREL